MLDIAGGIILGGVGLWLLRGLLRGGEALLNDMIARLDRP